MANEPKTLGNKPKPTNKEPVDERGLTWKQEQFAQEFVKSMNTVDAAKKAGYGETYAKAKAHRILRNEKVAKRIEQIRREMSAHTTITPEEVLRRVYKIADKADNAQDYGNALRALDQVGRLLGMYVDKSEVKVENAFSSGDDEAAIARDTKHLARVAGLKVIQGGKPDDPQDT